MHDLNRKITIAVLWNSLSLATSRGASMFFTLVLARFLTPEDFGLLAMMAIAFQIAASIVQSGLGAALIRSISISDEDLSTVFWTNLLLSVLAYLGIFFTAPYLATYYAEPELALLLRVTGLVVFLNALSVVQLAIHSRHMNFKVQMRANTAGMLVSGCVAIYLAYTGAGVWSLVAQMLIAASISSSVLWLGSSWLPSFTFNIASFRRLSRFGVSLLSASLIEIAFQNSYIMVIGKLFTVELTGVYFFARRLSQIVYEQLTNAVQQATFPALSTLQNNNQILRNKYRQIVQLLMFIVAPAMCLLIALAEPIFRLLFNENWQTAIPYFQLLCIIGLLYPLHALNVNILNVKGRSDLLLIIELIKKSVGLCLLFFAIPFGLTSIVISQVIGSALALIPNTFFSRRLLEYGIQSQLLDMAKPLLAAVFSGGVAWASHTILAYPPFPGILIGISTGLISYVGVSELTRAEGYMIFRHKILKHYRAEGD